MHIVVSAANVVVTVGRVASSDIAHANGGDGGDSGLFEVLGGESANGSDICG
jgi:hypothetical protein